MRFKKQFSLISVVMLLFLICSCEKGENGLKMQVSPSNKTLVDLASKVYDDSQLFEIAEFKGTMNELDKKYPVECLRQNDDAYHVSYLGNERVAVLLFDNSGNKVFGKVYIAKKSKSDFDTLVKGQSVDDVMAFDPDGEYAFLYTSSGGPLLSAHCTKDGYGIYIEYDASWIIINTYEELL